MRAMPFTVAIAAALLATVPSHPSAADPASRFAAAPASVAADGFRPVFTPLGVGSAPTTVVVELAGDPVAVASAKAAVPFTKGEKAVERDRLRRQQAPVEDGIRARGGAVLASYQHAYNGVKVRIASDKVKELAALPGVVAVHRLQLFKPDNVHGVPLIGAPAVWGGLPAFHGEGVKVAIIDTGIDYTHADFGGPGTAAAYAAAHAAEAAPADPSMFGPDAPKVKGGIDLVGDSYDADPSSAAYQPVPHPDPNPLDCNGHGSHVAGTVGGYGVLATGGRYTGAYDASTVASQSWLVGPGVAPKADLYAVRVFGCEGSTDVTVDAIEWAVANDMDVINMSLGSPFGSADEPSAVAASNAAKAGVIVVASAGNSGPAPYITGSPASAPGALSVAASDPTASFPGADVALLTATVKAIVANGAPFADGTTLPVVVLKAGGDISLGCDPAEYVNANVAGKIVVTRRGTCARVARAVFGQQAGAAAVIMLNSSAAFPPYEGPITGNPDTGEQYTVTIPFLGIPLTAANKAALIAADGGSAGLTNTSLANPGYLALGSFSSGGPRTGDSGLKPEVTAPGVSIASVAVGTGNGFAFLSGTSMAAPHAAGAAALVRQAHPDWMQPRYWKAALVQTADPSLVTGYATRNAGGGLVQVQSAVATQVVATVDDGAVLSFGFAELDRDLSSKKDLVLRNFGSKPATFDVAPALASGSAHTITVRPSRVTVPPGRDAKVSVALAVPAATAGDSSAFGDVAGVVAFTPVNGANRGVALRVPYYLVPQAVSHVATAVDLATLLETGTATATVTNERGAIAGAADWYAWGIWDRKDRKLGSNDLRAVGVQTFPSAGVLAFAIDTYSRWSNPAMNEFDVFVDVNGDGAWDYDVVAIDLGAITAGSFNGQVAVAVFTPDGTGSIRLLADAPTDSSTMVLPVFFSQLCKAKNPCVSPTTPITYWVESFGLTDGTSDAILDARGKPVTAAFDLSGQTISTGMYDVVPPGGAAAVTVSIDPARFAQAPALGFMVVTHDNPSKKEAQLVGLDGEGD